MPDHGDLWILSLRSGDSLPNAAFGFLQGGGGLGSGHTGGEHHDRDWSSIAAGFKSVAGCVVIGSGGLFEDADGALDEFLVLGPNIDHEVAVDVSQACHGSGGDHVQDHLVSGARFHAGGSGENFGSDFSDDGEISGALERGFAVAGKGDGAGSAATGVFDGGDGERSASAAGDAEDNIVLAGLALLHFLDGKFGIVFAGFGGGGEGFRTSGHDVLHGARIGVERRRDFGCVEGADAATGSGAHVDEASTLAESGDDDVDGAGNLRQSAGDCGGDSGVFVVDEPDDFERRHAVEISGGG